MTSKNGCQSLPNRIPGISSAYVVDYERNNTAILAECCANSPITSSSETFTKSTQGFSNIGISRRFWGMKVRFMST
ncbi:uncharacterized protein RCO7_14739 [Rhynchosporium graminicola]|uniref:Uncharacterized protein n=1 Tax=Rhynchosporium graminicola TaxID=2792576 RepID=A0A1E1L273_9HELO|nr:uncharacterized protein RCO7_14739 [Rhynchosporium commune]